MVFKVQKVGGDERNRTADPLLARQVLSQLSYAPTFLLLSAKTCLVGLSGLEPLTSRLSGVRSNQLSYRPFCFSLRAAPSKLNINQRMCVDLKSVTLANRCLFRHRCVCFVDILYVLSPRTTRSSLNPFDYLSSLR